MNGIQNTPNKMSETAKFNRNTLVMVRIRRFCTNVNMTSVLPTRVNNKIVAYNGIWMRALENQSSHVVSADTWTGCGAVDAAIVAAVDSRKFRAVDVCVVNEPSDGDD